MKEKTDEFISEIAERTFLLPASQILFGKCPFCSCFGCFECRREPSYYNCFKCKKEGVNLKEFIAHLKEK